MKLFYTAAIFASLFSIQGHADILFLDLNGNPKEIEATRAAAEKRGEKVVVIPEITKEVAVKQLQLKAVTNKAREAYGASRCDLASGNAQKCETLRKNLDQAEKNFRAFTDQTKMTQKKLSDKLGQLKSQGVQLSSIVLSGHDGNGHFAGTFGELSDKELSEAFQKNSPVGDSVRSMALWGCYTANIGSLSQYWKKALPNVEVIAGFDEKGPLGNSPANWAYLKDFLTKEKSLSAIKDEKELQKALSKIEGANITNASICVGGKYASKEMAMDLSNAQSLCEGSYLKDSLVYDCYLNAGKGCENPPSNTSTSELRTFYENLQQYAHCNEIIDRESKPDTPSRDKLIRLIFYKEVKKNFSDNFKLQMEAYNSQLKKVGAPKELIWGDITKMTRAEILAKLNATSDFLAGKNREDSALRPELQAIGMTFSMGIQPVLGDLNTPFAWVEPNASAPEGMANGMASASAASVTRFRNEYEGTRASNLMDSKLDAILKTNPATKNQMAAILSKAADLQRRVENGANFRDVMGPFQELDEQKKKLRSTSWKLVSNELNDYKTQLQSEEYASPEGKQVFNAKLNELIKTYAKDAQ